MILFAAVRLTEFSKLRELWNHRNDNVIVWLCSFFLTLGLSVAIGVLGAAFASIIILLYRLARPKYIYRCLRYSSNF